MPRTILHDHRDKFYWDRIVTTTSTDNVIQSRLTEYDNGVTRDEVFEHGQLRSSFLRDIDGSGGERSVKSWDNIETLYSDTGQISRQIGRNDDSTIKVKEYEDGVLRFVSRMDDGVWPHYGQSDVKDWSRIDTYFDEAGIMTLHVRVEDDGMITYHEFENGMLRRAVREDLDNSRFSTDTHEWDRIELYYDENGKIDLRVQENDNGVMIFDEYEANVLRVSTEEDFGFAGGLLM